jgi:hypothetical protein
MSTISLSTQTADRQMARDLADAEAAKIGAAAERKRREESENSIEAVLASDGSGGRAVYWRRRVRVSGENRESLEVERSGAYTERGFLRLCEKAAGQAGKGRWNRPEAVEAVAAELVVRTMAKTGGRVPKVGSIGRADAGHENPDLAYLTAAARRLIVSALRGEDAGLASEAAPIGDADQDQDHELSLAELMGEADAAAEGPRDPYIAEPAQKGADLLNPQAKAAAGMLASFTGGSVHNTEAAIVAIFRSGVAKSADIADAGYAASPAAARKAAQRGRDLLRPVLSDALRERQELLEDPDAEVSGRVQILDSLCENEDGERAEIHAMEGTPHGTYRRPKIDWPMVTQPAEPAPVRCYQVSA